jgi:hypothetical protein
MAATLSAVRAAESQVPAFSMGYRCAYSGRRRASRNIDVLEIVLQRKVRGRCSQFEVFPMVCKRPFLFGDRQIVLNRC